MKRLATALALVLAAAGAVAAPAQALTVTSTADTAYGFDGTVRVDNARTARRGSVRSGYVLPATWRRRGPIDRGVVGFVAPGCGGFSVWFTARLVETPTATSTRERTVAAIAHAGSDAFHGGTRQSAAWRVAVAGDVAGVLVQPITDRNAPSGRRLFSETSVVARTTRRCSVRDKRLVADTLARALAAGRAGGFSYDRSLPGFRFRLRRSSLRRLSRTGYAPFDFALTLPAAWPRRGDGPRSSLRFGPLGSCRITVTLTPRAVRAAPGTASERALALIPGGGRYVLGTGTSDDAAFRVVRDQSSDTVRGVLVRSTGAEPGNPAAARFEEMGAVAEADPATECHSGGPRTVGDALAAAFAGGRLGA